MEYLSVEQTATRAEINVPIFPPVLGKYIPIRVVLSMLSQISDQRANPICRVEGDGSASTIPATTMRSKPVATVGLTCAVGRARSGRPYANALNFLLVISIHECGEESPNSSRLPGYRWFSVDAYVFKDSKSLHDDFLWQFNGVEQPRIWKHFLFRHAGRKALDTLVRTSVVPTKIY